MVQCARAKIQYNQNTITQNNVQVQVQKSAKNNRLEVNVAGSIPKTVVKMFQFKFKRVS